MLCPFWFVAKAQKLFQIKWNVLFGSFYIFKWKCILKQNIKYFILKKKLKQSALTQLDISAYIQELFQSFPAFWPCVVFSTGKNES